MQKYNKIKYEANLLLENLKNYDLQAVVSSLLCNSIPFYTDTDEPVNTTGILIARELLPFMTERSEANAIELLDAFSLSDIKRTLINIIQSVIKNADTLVGDIQCLFDFLVLIDRIRNDAELKECAEHSTPEPLSVRV